MTTIFPNYEVVVIEEEPFVNVEKDKDGNDLFSGLAIDVLKFVAEKAQFTYSIKRTAHEYYGYQKDQDSWNGLLSEISNKNADLAVGPIPEPLKKDVSDLDFTKPFMSTGVNLLVKYPPESVQGIGLMLDPFASEVWVMVCLAFVVVSLALYLIGRFSPYEKVKVLYKEKEFQVTHANFDLKSSFLFTASTLGWQGYKDAPRSISGRILICIWFLFTVLIISAYTASLCSILTKRTETFPQHLPFADYEDIVNIKNVKIGAMKYHNVYQMLKNGKDSHNYIHLKLFNYIDESHEWIQKNNEGIQRVKDSGGRYGLLMETVKADYIASTNCDLITFGEKLSTFGYTFAAKKSSPLLERINFAILELNESGYIHELIKKYFQKKNTCPAYDKTKIVPQRGGTYYSRYTTGMNMRDLAIPFLFLFLGLLGSGGALGAEYYYKTKLLQKNVNDATNKQLHTENVICKAPKVSPPPPPIYKLNNKLQELENEKGIVSKDVVKLEMDREEDEENEANNIEMALLNEREEINTLEETKAQIEEIPTSKEVVEIHEL